MRKPFTGPDSIVAMAVRPLLILAVALAAFLIAPTGASAAPAGADSTVLSGVSDTATTLTTVSGKADSAAGARAVFTCRYSALPPFQTAGFTCTVSSGSMQVIMNCADGRRVFGPILWAFGTYNFNLSCAPAQFVTFNYQSLS
ncbi:hypothetical protein [Actinophytocola xanthii]|uniref:Subtilisin inhibitor domain-containing protein n=1 Tax=Actinophytocola xanthii TaxID=1912961 RepID=A0A1Q8C7V7_9PSEU|nr:hypothetical protein [Actinophytocola xanthii]OLF10393.1 hypothetical protein BU204_31845 [Actinophytocola xanthii]